MATINDKELVDKLIADNGSYEDDTPVVKIVQYNNIFNGGISYGLIYEGMRLDYYQESEFVRNPVTIFTRAAKR